MAPRICFLLIAVVCSSPLAFGQTVRVETSLGNFDVELMSGFSRTNNALTAPSFHTSGQDPDAKAKVKPTATAGRSNLAAKGVSNAKNRRLFRDGSMDPMLIVLGHERDATAASVILSAPEHKDSNTSNVINNASATPMQFDMVLTQVATPIGL